MDHYLHLGWTDEDQEIWRARQMLPHMIYKRYQTHMREAEMMVALSHCDLPPGEGKMLFMALTDGEGWKT
jgi:hypothetical protein